MLRHVISGPRLTIRPTTKQEPAIDGRYGIAQFNIQDGARRQKVQPRAFPDSVHTPPFSPSLHHYRV